MAGVFRVSAWRTHAPPHSKLSEWNRHQSNKPILVKFVETLLPKRFVDEVDDRKLDYNWKNSGVVDYIKVAVPSHPGTYVEQQVHVRGDGFIMSGFEGLNEKLADSKFYKTADASDAPPVEIHDRFVKGVTWSGYKYEGAPKNMNTADVNLTHSQVAARVVGA